MRSLGALLVRVAALWRRDRREAELAAELDSHLHLHIDDNLRAGMTVEAARREALLKLGGVEVTKELWRDRHRIPIIDTLWQDVRFAGRLFVKERWVTVTAVVTLALGLAASNTVFTIANAMVFRGLPVAHPDRIVTFNETSERLRLLSYRDLEDWRAASKTFAGIAAYNGAGMTVGDEGRSPEVFFGSYISANAFRLIDEKPMLGRDFQPEDDRSGAPAVVILGHALWTTRYGADPAIIGRTIRVNDVASTVIGVMREGVRFPLVDELWQPLAIMPGLSTERREPRTLRVFGRLADRVTISGAQAELNAITVRLSHDYPETNQDIRGTVRPFTGTVNNPMFRTLFGAVALVLLIACANVANVLLARSAHRAREMSIRVSVGASRWRIVRQLLVESSLLAVLAGLLGLALSIACVRLFANAVSGITFAYWYYERWTMDGRVFAFLFAVSLGTVFVFGLVPALQLSKTNVSESLKDCGRTGTGRGTHRWTAGLLVVELSFTLVLLVSATLLMRSFVALHRADLVVDTSHVLTMTLRLPNQKYPPDRRIAFYQRLEARLDAIGAISSAAIASTVPFIGGPQWQIEIQRRPRLADQAAPTASFVRIGSRYFETLAVGLLRGRTFSDLDGTAGHESAIVNQRFVGIHFPSGDAIGQRIRATNPNARNAPSPWLTIVGVSPTVRQQYLAELDPVVYLPYRANPTPTPWLMVRSETDPDALASLVREEVRALDVDVPVSRITPLETLMTQSRWGHSVIGTMFAVFATIAVILAAVGVYAVTAYGVSQRTAEIGVRMALGAEPLQVMWLFLRRTAVQIAIGVPIGLAGAFGAGQVIRPMLVQTSASDPVTLISAAMLLSLVAVAACLWPARRATSIHPLAALRCL